MALLRDLFGFSDAQAPPAASKSDSIREITRKLDGLPREKARYIAAFSYLLGRVAHADLDISATETAAMERIVVDHGGLSAEEAIIVVQMAKSQNMFFGGTENYLVTREFKKMSQQKERIRLLKCLFAVSSSDQDISVIEDNEIGQIARELGVSHKEFIRTRSSFRDYLAVLRTDPAPIE